MNTIITKVKKLIDLYHQGKLGGEVMPEDNNPRLDKGDEVNYIYFTLPMALNYQRNSYKLWESALMTYQDPDTYDIFVPKRVVDMSQLTLQQKLTKYKVALQPNKQPIIWQTLCKTLCDNFDGSVKKLFESFDFDIQQIKTYILNNKKSFPYLSGTKILNYWLYVMTQYTDGKFVNRSAIDIAPDTHVLQASVKLGIISQTDLAKNNIRDLVNDKWRQLLQGSGIEPIDLHTPFWLWSRNGFVVEV